MSFQAGDELGVSSPSAASTHEHRLNLHDPASPASSAAPATAVAAAAAAAAEVLHNYPTSAALLPPVLPALSTDMSPMEEEEVGRSPPASSAAAAAAAHASAALFLGPLAAEEESTAVHASGFSTAVHSSSLSTLPEVGDTEVVAATTTPAATAGLTSSAALRLAAGLPADGAGEAVTPFAEVYEQPGLPPHGVLDTMPPAPPQPPPPPQEPFFRELEA
ncbi:unnamed protein product, partial [Ectocarpus sp. 12 AP-2014]